MTKVQEIMFGCSLLARTAAFVSLVAAPAAADLVDFPGRASDALLRQDAAAAVSDSAPEIAAFDDEAANDLIAAADFAPPDRDLEERLTEIDGGPQYYSRFYNGLPDDPNFFPVAVWFESVLTQRDIDLDKEAGLNTYVVLTRNSDLDLVESSGMHFIAQQSEWRNESDAVASPSVVGWELNDEIDMTEGPSTGYATMDRISAELPHDNRLRYNNYGKGVMFWETNEEAARFVNGYTDIVSADIYWFTDPNVDNASEGGALLNRGEPLSEVKTRRAANYGFTVDRLRALDVDDDGIRQPVWNFVEVGWPSTETELQGARQIAPDEIRAAVWHSIIAGARGIIYFNHSFGGPNQTQHALREPAYAAQRAAVKATNALIHELAPVLNAPSADNFVNIDGGVRVMAKKSANGVYFVFAGSLENAKSQPTFTLAGINSGKAIVVGENRTIPIVDGTFSDVFADGNAIHIYRIERDETGSEIRAQ